MNKTTVIFLSLFLISPIFAVDDRVTITPMLVEQGKTMKIVVNRLARGESVRGKFIGRKIDFFQGDNCQRGFVGIPLEQKPGKYPLHLTIDGLAGGTKTINKTVVIAKGKFPVVSFWLKPAKNKLRSRELINNEWADVEKVLVVKEPVKRWRGRFDFPVKAPTSMVFGVVQKVNGKPSGRHRGYDLAVPEGTVVTAPNEGKVVYLGRLKAFGNTIVVDHGLGVQTLYFHLSKFLVEVGQVVNRGDKLALSGNTGISSGAHLHWGMSVNNLRIDPAQWTKVEM